MPLVNPSVYVGYIVQRARRAVKPRTDVEVVIADASTPTKRLWTRSKWTGQNLGSDPVRVQQDQDSPRVAGLPRGCFESML